jgi:molybdopterin synthase sulfur carrier subunit
MTPEVVAANADPGYIAEMQVRLLAFAQTRDQLGFDERLVECAAADTPRSLLARLAPGFSATGLRVAVDCEYCEWDTPLGSAVEVAIIPPVSGG